MTLSDYWNIHDITTLFLVSTASPAGETYVENLDGEDDDFICIHDVIENAGSDLWDLDGTANEDGWEWNGRGNPTDWRGNSYLRISAS